MNWLVIEQVNNKKILVNLEDASTVEPATLRRASTNEKFEGIRITMHNGRTIDTQRSLEDFMATLQNVAMRSRADKLPVESKVVMPMSPEAMAEEMLKNAKDDEERKIIMEMVEQWKSKGEPNERTV